ncbi:MAG TPA: hypothetical protein VN259_14880 [Xanthomonadales bacterium]|nr:hypothetical protein [Xanthomonadales bacterium]
MRNVAAVLATLIATSTSASAQNAVDWFGVDGLEFASPARVMRFTDLDLRDPHVFLPITIAPFPTVCFDFTDNPIPTTTVSFNGNLQASYNSDSNPADGFLDASSLLWFRPLAQDGRVARVDNGGADCLAPAPTSGCAPSATATPTAYTYASFAAGSCLTALPGTLGAPAYSPAIVSPTGACFVTAPKTFVFDNNGTPITLVDAQIAAVFNATPATALSNGLLRGFLRESDANQIVISDPALPGGSVTLAGLLAGGNGSCSTRNDKDSHQGESGWWFYFNFSASQVTFTGP